MKCTAPAPFVILFAIPSIVLAQATADSKPAQVAGTVVNSVTGEPLRKADLTLTTSLLPPGTDAIAKQFGLDDDRAGAAPKAPPAPEKTFKASTDAAGKFRFENVDPGDYYLSAKHASFVDLQFKAPAKLAFEGRLHLTPGREAADLELRLVPNGAAAGKVVDEDGDPVASSMVTALTISYLMGHRSLQPVDVAQSNDRGEFRLGKLPQGRYYLCATQQDNPMAQAPEPPKDGSRETAYVPSYFPHAIDPAQAELIEVKPGDDLPGFVIHLQKSLVVRVKGTALSADGKPIQSGMLMLMGGAGGISSMRMFTFHDPAGKFELFNLAPGSYTATLMQMGGGAQPTMLMQPLAVPDHNLDNVRLGAPPEGTVKGRIVAASDAKVALKDVTISLQAAEDTPTLPARGRADESGSFVVAKVAPDRYMVSLSPQPAGTYTKSVLWNGRDVLGQQLDLTSGMGGDLEVVLGTDGGKVGVKVSRDDQPVADATVVLLPADATQRFSETTLQEDSDEHGEASFQNVRPGNYLVLAWTDVEEGQWFDPAFVKRFEAQAQKLTLNAKGNEKLSVRPAVEAK